MALFRWREALSLGHATIDRDHKHLIALLNRIHFMGLAGDDRSAIGEVLAELVSYTKYHFRREEAMMRLGNYPDREDHCNLHRELIERLVKFEASFIDEPENFPLDEFYEFVADWLMIHIMREDMKLQPYVKDLASAHNVAA